MKVGVKGNYYFQRGGKIDFEQWHIREGQAGGEGLAICGAHVGGRAVFGWSARESEGVDPNCLEIAKRKGILSLT